MTTYDDVAFGPKQDPEVIAAVHTLREYAKFGMVAGPVCEAIETLDNAQVFKAIDEATGYDIGETPPRQAPSVWDARILYTMPDTPGNRHVDLVVVGHTSEGAEKEARRIFGTREWTPPAVPTVHAVSLAKRTASVSPGDYTTVQGQLLAVAQGVAQAHRDETRDRGDFSQHLGEMD